MDKGHGRIEKRKIQTTTILNDYVNFPYVEQVCRIERVTWDLDGEHERREVVYAVTSLPPEDADAKRLLHINRGHWCIENRLHWVRDVTYNEDHSQIRTGEGPRTMATLRNLAISLHRLHDIKNIAKALRSFARKPERALRLLGL
jgi:predicted transposase YbfD/YdcC